MTPTEFTGLGLIILALALFLVEIKAPGFGVAGVGGTAALIAGLVLLFGLSWVSLPALLIAGASLAGLCLFLAVLSYRARRLRVVTGEAGMVGLEGRAETPLLPEGKVCVRGELWDAWSPVRLERGTRVRIVAVRGLRVEVTAADPDRALVGPVSAVPPEPDGDG